MEDQYCRLCMAEENLCGMNSSIRNCMENEYSIKIKDEDELSKEICGSCQTFALEIIKFREKFDEFGDRIIKVQKLLQKILKRKHKRTDSDVIRTAIEETPITLETLCTSTPQKTDKTDGFDDLTDSNVSSSNDFISKIVKSIDLDEVERAAHQIRNTSNPVNNFCVVCKIKIVDTAKFQRHFKSGTHIFKAYIIQQSGDSDIFAHHTVGYKCATCSKVFTSKKMFAAHSKTNHERPINKNLLMPNTLIPKNIKSNNDGVMEDVEDIPEFEIKNEPNSSEIIENPISKLKAHPCVACKKSFGFLESLQRHQKKHHKETLFCIHCNFTTINRRSFSDHLRKHYNLTHQRVCSTCFKVCQSYSDLITHRNDVHNKAVVQVCLLCDAKFATSTLLKKHKRDVHRTKSEGESQKKFRCRKCNRRFQTLLVLEKHQCTMMKYPCLKKCGKRFESYGKMERHAVRCNSGKTIFSCKKCRKSLRSLKSLKMHLTKCSLKIPLPSFTKSNIEVSDEKNQAPCSSLIQPPPIEINDIFKKRGIDSAVTSTSKKTKLSAEDIPQNTFNCTNCYKVFLSAIELCNHRKLCKMTSTRIFMKTKQKSAQPVKKKEKKSKLTEVKVMTRLENRQLTESEEKSKPSISSNSIDNSKTLERTMDCQTCGLLFKDNEFLAQHESTVHTLTSSDSSKHITEVFEKVGNENTQQPNGLSAVPNFDNTTRVWKLKLKQTPPSLMNQNIIQVRDAKTPFTKFGEVNQTISTRNDVDCSTENYSSEPDTISSSFKFSKIAEVDQTIPTQNNDSSTENRRSQSKFKKRYSNSSGRATKNSDRSPNTPQNDIEFRRSFQPRSEDNYVGLFRQKTYSTTENSTEMSSKKPNDYKVAFSSRHHIPGQRNSRWDCPYRRNTYTPTAHIGHWVADQNLYSENTRASFSSRLEPRIDFRRGPVVKSSKVASSTSQILREDFKTSKRNNLAIICGICKNSIPHLFCNPCSRCFLKNEVQYSNHMKMKHS